MITNNITSGYIMILALQYNFIIDNIILTFLN